MSINAQIIDQRLTKRVEDLRQRAAWELGIKAPDAVKSLAFLHLCVSIVLDLDEDWAFDCLTDGGGDLGVDAMYVGSEQDGQFPVTLFQAKYHRDLSGTAAFPGNGLEKLVLAVRTLFDPASPVQLANPRLRAKIEEARSLIRDGFIPRVRCVACINGRQWQVDGDETIARASLPDSVSWDFVNHDRLVAALQATQPVDETIKLTGKALVEDLDFKRILVGRISVQEIAALISRHGERLLERNIRRYLGLHGNRVNEEMRQTLLSDDSRNFYVYNNGVTMTCDGFSYNALQGADFTVRAKNLQIINGGQTCMTIARTFEEKKQHLFPMDGPAASVLVRLYELPSGEEDLIQRITLATNSQNPVDLKDLRANDEVQKRLETDLEGLGYRYRRKRSVAPLGQDITTGVAAEAILSVLRRRPHQARFFAREHFGKLYGDIFTTDLNGAQVLASVLLYRIAENHRRRAQEGDPDFVRYASCFIAMQMGRRLFASLGVDASAITHAHVSRALELITEHGETWFREACDDLQRALEGLYGPRKLSLQQLSATFRRGDLIESLR